MVADTPWIKCLIITKLNFGSTVQVGPHRRNAVNKVAEIQIFQRLLYITPDFTRPIDIINVAGKYEKWYLCID